MTETQLAKIAVVMTAAIDPTKTYQDIFELFDASIDNQQFTAMKFHADTMELERIYSTTPDSYPVGARKPKADSEWGRRVLIERLLHVGEGADDMKWAFSDYKKILDLGLDNVLNVPVVAGGRVTGTINFLRGGRPFDAAEQVTGQLLAALLAARQVLME